MRCSLATLVAAAVLGAGLTEAHAGGYRDSFRNSFTGNAIASLISRMPQKAVAKASAPVKPGVMARLRAWAAQPRHIQPPATKGPPLAKQNGAMKASLQARWNAFRGGLTQRTQGVRSSSTAFLAKLRQPGQLFRMPRREALKTAQAAQQHDPTLWQRTVAIVKTNGQSSTALIQKRLNMFGFLARQQNKQTLSALNQAAAAHHF